MIPPKLFSHAHPRAHFCYQLCFHKPALYRTLFRAIIASRNLHVKIFDQILNIIFVLKSVYYKGRRGMAHAFRRGGDPSASGFPYPGVQISPSIPSRKIHRKNDAADSVEVNTTIEATVKVPCSVEISKHSIRNGGDGSANALSSSRSA